MNRRYVNRTGGSAFCPELKKEAEDDGARDVLQEFVGRRTRFLKSEDFRKKKGDKVRIGVCLNEEIKDPCGKYDIAS